jgi:hypothetical protein
MTRTAIDPEVVLDIPQEVVLDVPQEVVRQEVVVVFPDGIPLNGWDRQRQGVLQVVLEAEPEVVLEVVPEIVLEVVPEVVSEVVPEVVLEVVLEVLPLTYLDGILLKNLQRLNYVSDAVLKAD